MARSKLVKFLIKSLCAVALLLLLAFGGLIAWVATGPRSLNAFTPYIESALLAPGSSYKVKIGNSLLIWDGMLHPIGIRVSDMDVLDGTGAVVAHFPKVGLRMYFFKLIFGEVNIKSIELLGPTTKLVQDEHGNITSFGFSGGGTETNAPIGAALALLASDGENDPLAHLQSFIIRHAALSVEDSRGNAFLSSADSFLEITRQPHSATGKLRMPLAFGEKRGDIDVSFHLDGAAKAVDSMVIFSEIPSGVLHALAPAQEWMGGVNVPLSGFADMKSDFDAHIGSITFQLDAGKGIIDLPDQFEKPLRLEHIALSGALTHELTLLTLDKARLDFGQVSISFKGTVNRQGDDYGVDGDVETANVPVNDVHHYWPLKLAPHSRRWVTTRLSGGKIVKAGCALHFKPGEFKLKDTPEAAVNAPITVKGTTIIYKPSAPPITDVDGVVTFTGRTMDAKITSAHYLDATHVTSGRARFPDFYPDDVRMFIEMELTTTAKDVQRFLSQPDLNKAAKLNLTSAITGEAKGSAKLDFIAFAENEKNDVSATGKINYTVEANLLGVSQPRFLGNRDVENAMMKISLDNKGLKASGKAKINGVPMHIDLATNFAKGHETSYAVKADMPVARLPDFGLPKLEFATGSIGADATFLSSDTEEKSQAMLDLTRTGISLPQHGFSKPQGKKASLKLATERLPSGNTRISAFTLKEDGEMASGSAEYDRKTQDFSSFSFAPLRIGRQDLDSLAFRQSDNQITLTGSGRVFDASPYLASANKQTEFGYAINLKADRLILGDGRELAGAKILADCPPDRCRTAQISARLANGAAFNYAIAGGKLDASCDDAGELARTLDIFTTIDGGKLSLRGDYVEGKLEGTLEVLDYTLKKAPILTKAFTIASLSGILDTLSGNGIYFSKLTAPYIYHRGIIILKGARTHGAALGLTADGMIDTNKNTLDLTGLLVPSYTMNSLVGNIPLIGDWLMGGKGRGLLALSYGIHGDMKDPHIAVNPLSVLTPGFLRDIFDVFDKPPPDMDTIEKAQKAAVEKSGGQEVAPAPVAPAQQPVTALPAPASTLPSLDELRK